MTIQILDAYRHELEALLRAQLFRRPGLLTLEHALKENEELTELLRQQRRAMEHALGKPVEPEAHSAEGVLVGVFGQ